MVLRGTVLVAVFHRALAYVLALILLWEATLACSFASLVLRSLSCLFPNSACGCLWSISFRIRILSNPYRLRCLFAFRLRVLPWLVMSVQLIVLLVGWASHRWHDLLGMVSYELPMTMVVLTLASLVRDGGGRGISLRAGDGRGGFISLRA